MTKGVRTGLFRNSWGGIVWIAFPEELLDTADDVLGLALDNRKGHSALSAQKRGEAVAGFARRSGREGRGEEYGLEKNLVVGIKEISAGCKASVRKMVGLVTRQSEIGRQPSTWSVSRFQRKMKSEGLNEPKNSPSRRCGAT